MTLSRILDYWGWFFGGGHRTTHIAWCLSSGRDRTCVCQLSAIVKWGQGARRSRLELGNVLTDSLFLPDISPSGEIVFHVDWVRTAQPIGTLTVVPSGAVY